MSQATDAARAQLDALVMMYRQAGLKPPDGYAQEAIARDVMAQGFTAEEVRLATERVLDGLAGEKKIWPSMLPWRPKIRDVILSGRAKDAERKAKEVEQNGGVLVTDLLAAFRKLPATIRKHLLAEVRKDPETAKVEEYGGQFLLRGMAALLMQRKLDSGELTQAVIDAARKDETEGDNA